MFYRYEARRPGIRDEWAGICQVLTPDHKRQLARFLTDPKWYDTHPDVDTRCWLTQYGYDKYHTQMEKIISNCNEWYFPIEVRLLQIDVLPDIVMAGKTQCISTELHPKILITKEIL